jgi:uncharacterized damage-inducible protein DinB
MTTLLVDRLQKSFKIYDELAAHLSEVSLSSKLSTLPSNTIGQQLWCVVGARESYINGIQKGEWDGFSCSLKVTNKKKEVSEALTNSAALVINTLNDFSHLSNSQEKLAFDLLEHEIQHQGQLIRYLYGLKLGVPTGLKERYHLD